MTEAERSLTEIAGIGKDLAEKVATLVQTGSLPLLDELLAKTPESVLAILRVPGLGPKRAAQLYHDLNVATLDDLRAACESHKVQDLKGFGAKTEAAILQGLEIASEAGRRILWIEADEHVREILAHMNRCPAVEQIAAAGSYRRGKETVGDLDFLVVTRDVGAVMDHLASSTARRRFSPGATRRCRCAWAPACKWTSARWPPSRSAPPGNISPARKSTTSCCGAGPRRGD